MINKVIKDWIFNRQVDINVTVFDSIRFNTINYWSYDNDCTLDEFVKAKAYNVIYNTIVDSEEPEDKSIKMYIFDELLWDYISENSCFNVEHNPMTVLYCNIITEEFMKYISTLKDGFYQNIVDDIIKKHYMSSSEIKMGSELDELLAIFIKCVGKTHTCREIDHDIKAILNHQTVELSFKVPKNLSDEELVKHLTLLVKNKCFLTLTEC